MASTHRKTAATQGADYKALKVSAADWSAAIVSEVVQGYAQPPAGAKSMKQFIAEARGRLPAGTSEGAIERSMASMLNGLIAQGKLKKGEFRVSRGARQVFYWPA